MQRSSVFAIAVAIATVVAVACEAYSPPQWGNTNYSPSGWIPYNLPANTPANLFNASTGSAATGVVLDYHGNAFFVSSDSIYYWSPDTNSLNGPFYERPDTRTPAVSKDSSLLFVPYAALSTTGNYSVMAIDIEEMIRTNGNDSAIRWNWEANSEHNYRYAYNVIYAAGDYVLVSAADTWVACLAAETGQQIFYQDTATIVPYATSETKRYDARIFPDFTGSSAYMLRADGYLFRFEVKTGAATFFNLNSLVPPEDQNYAYCTISIDELSGTVYATAYVNDARIDGGTTPSVFAFTPSLQLKWNMTSWDEPPYGSAPLTLGDGTLLLGTDQGIERIRESDGASLNATIADEYGTENVYLYSPSTRTVLMMNYVFTRTLRFIDPDTMAIKFSIDASQATEYSNAEWDYSGPVAVDSTGRIIVAGPDSFWVYGCPFGQHVNAAGQCASGCPAGYEVSGNSCLRLPPSPATQPPASSATILSFSLVALLIIATMHAIITF